MKKYILAAVCSLSLLVVFAQGNVHPQSSTYQWPQDPLVKTKLEKWQDQKFGMIVHWGLYAVPGIIESWSLCSESWIERDSASSYDKYKEWYWGLQKDFNPVQFNPEQWASAASAAGMRYVVFTTKHHDGFSMFDTRQSDFRISNGPFGSNPRADVAKYVFEAFRKEGFMIGAYFSKPDWHSEYFWWPKYATPDRNVNYDIRRYPWRWKKFQDFTYNQIDELMHRYGSIDILWLDGGWVRPLETVTDEVRSWGAPIPPFSMEVNMPRIAAMAREAQPGLLIVDRTVHGEFENYQTPEQRIPEKALDYPWESCITLGDAWGHVPNDNYKSSSNVIHTLIEIVAKGGSLLLGVGPGPDGTLNEMQIARLKEIGDWLKVNGDAIYGTRATTVYRSGDVFFTKGKNSMNAIVTFQENGKRDATITWTGNPPAKGSAMRVVGTNEKVKWKMSGDQVVATLPRSVTMSKAPAVALSYTVVADSK